MVDHDEQKNGEATSKQKGSYSNVVGGSLPEVQKMVAATLYLWSKTKNGMKRVTLGKIKCRIWDQ